MAEVEALCEPDMAEDAVWLALPEVDMGKWVAFTVADGLSNL